MGSPEYDKTLAVQELMRKFRTELEDLLQGEPAPVSVAVLEEIARMESRVVSLLNTGRVPVAVIPGYGSPAGSQNSGGINFSRGDFRRRGQQYSSTTITSDTTEDGHAWRKYGQKSINGTNNPRSYYRCAQKHARGCPAQRQVQAMEEDPSKYLITYIGGHTCKRDDLTVAPNLSSTASTSLISFQQEIPMSSSPAGSYILPTYPTLAAGWTWPMPVAQAAGAAATLEQGESSSWFHPYVGSLEMDYCLGDAGLFADDHVFSFDPDDELFLQAYNNPQFPPY